MLIAAILDTILDFAARNLFDILIIVLILIPIPVIFVYVYRLFYKLLHLTLYYYTSYIKRSKKFSVRFLFISNKNKLNKMT